MRLFKVKVQGQVYNVEVEEVVENKVFTGEPEKRLERVEPRIPKRESPKAPPPPTRSQPLKVGDPGQVIAPIPGVITQVNVKSGEMVTQGAVLMILEAMKMQNEILSPKDGTVLEVLVAQGDQVSTGDSLIRLG